MVGKYVPRIVCNELSFYIDIFKPCSDKRGFNPFPPKWHILYSSKLKELADDNFKFNENGRKFSKRVENTVGKG